MVKLLEMLPKSERLLPSPIYFVNKSQRILDLNYNVVGRQIPLYIRFQDLSDTRTLSLTKSTGDEIS